MKIKSLFRLFLVQAVISALLVSALPVQAAAPYGVDHLRGRWDGVINGFDGSDQPFVLMLDKYGADPSNANAFLYNGCMKVGSGSYAPVSARAVALAYDQFDLTLFGTAYGQVIKMIGMAFTNAARVTDDPADGVWQTAWQAGDWSAFHHDRREPNCPGVNLGDGLIFQGDSYAAIGLDSDGNMYPGTLLEGFTNIVSSGMRVTMPDGTSVDAPFFTDLFSPTVNFIDSFRFLTNLPDLPVSNGTYTFALLDVFGQPIAGATTADIWHACMQDAPRNVTASVDASGITASWDQVPTVPGFDPNGITPLGFYQIELNPITGDGSFGAGGIRNTSHLIPFMPFGGFAPGFPDGENFGKALSELGDGEYVFDTIAFSVAVHPGGFGLECQIRSWDEQVYFEKSGDTITLLP